MNLFKRLKALVLALRIMDVAYKPINKYYKLLKKYDYDLRHLDNTCIIAYRFIQNNQSLYNVSTTPFLRGVLADIQYFINKRTSSEKVEVCASFMSIFKEFHNKINTK